MCKRATLIILLIAVSGAALCQPAGRKARKWYNSAQKNWSKYQKEKAYVLLQQAIAREPAWPQGYAQLGKWYFTQHEFQKAAEAYRDGSVKCTGAGAQFAMPLARSLIYSGMPDSALLVINRYKQNGKNTAAWNKLTDHAQFVKSAIHRLSSAWPVNLGMRINSRRAELFPAMSADSAELYFVRRVRNMDEDLFIAHADSCGEWMRPDYLPYPINGIHNESGGFVSADGHYLFFSRSDNRSPDGWNEGGNDLFMCYRIDTNSEWTVPTVFGGTLNTTDYEGMPSLSPDNQKLYFVSDRPGGYGGKDIWVTTFENNSWSSPVNAGPAINTRGDELAPYIAMDNKTLFFTSDGLPGMGGLDLYKARRVNDSTWKNVENLGYPINTAYDEMSTCLSAGGRTLYFSSDRNGPAGNYDIFSTQLPVLSAPDAVSYLGGIVYDSITQERLNSAAMFLINAHSGDTLYRFYSNRGDASYLLPVPQNLTYALHTVRIGYTDIHDTFSFNQQYTRPHFVRNVAMLPYDYVKPIHDSLIATVHFNINKIELSDSDKAAIYKGIEPFIMDKGIVLYVNGFTDNTGNPLLNAELSTKRAMLVEKTLVSMGIDELSIISKGWGEAKMVASNETEEGQRRNRRVEIILRRE